MIQCSINVLSKMLSKYFLINKFHTFINDIKEASITEKKTLLFYNIVKNNCP